jgi:outer membrane cobalamin receptor
MRNRTDALRVGAMMLAGAATAPGESREETVDETVIVANRLATPVEDVGSAFSALEVELLGRSGVIVLEDALRLVPGTGVGSEGGQRGSISAMRMRGSEADHTLILIDGMRVTDANVTPFNLLGAESLVGLSRIEVLRGPQSSLYGGEAIGGVVSLETGRGGADGRQSLLAEAGSFGSVRAVGQFQGDLRGMRWFLGGSEEITANDRAANDFEQQTAAVRVEGELGGSTTVGMTARFWNSELENPGGAGGGPSRGPAGDGLRRIRGPRESAEQAGAGLLRRGLRGVRGLPVRERGAEGRGRPAPCDPLE